MRIRVLLFSVLAAIYSAGSAAAASHFVVLTAPRGFSIPHIPHGVVLHGHPRTSYGAIGAYDTWLSGAQTLGPDEVTGALPPPPYPPVVYYPATYAPQTHCVRPKIIYLTDVKPAANPVRIIYGTAPPQCP